LCYKDSINNGYDKTRTGKKIRAKGYEQQGESCQIRNHHYVAKDLNRLTLAYKVRRIRSNEIILQFREN
jgi:hypothetical protein